VARYAKVDIYESPLLPTTDMDQISSIFSTNSQSLDKVFFLGRRHLLILVQESAPEPWFNSIPHWRRRPEPAQARGI